MPTPHLHTQVLFDKPLQLLGVLQMMRRSAPQAQVISGTFVIWYQTFWASEDQRSQDYWKGFWSSSFALIWGKMCWKISPDKVSIWTNMLTYSWFLGHDCESSILGCELKLLGWGFESWVHGSVHYGARGMSHALLFFIYLVYRYVTGKIHNVYLLSLDTLMFLS